MLCADPIPAFGAIRVRDVRSLAGPVVEARVPAGTELVHEGAIVGIFCVIRSGSAELRRGEEPLGLLGPGECFGESEPLEPGPQPFTIIARSSLHVLAFSAFGIDRFCAAIPGSRERILAHQARSLEQIVLSGGGSAAAVAQGLGVEHGDRAVVGRDPAQLAHQPQRARHGLARRAGPSGQLVLGQR